MLRLLAAPRRHWQQALPPAAAGALCAAALAFWRGLPPVEQAGAGAAVFAAVYLVSAWQTEAALEPVRRLRRAMQAEEPQLPPDWPARRGDAIGELGRTFGEMLARLRQQARAREAEESRLSAVLEQMRDGVLILDAEGVVQICNRAAARLFGLPRGQALGMSLARLSRDHRLVHLWQSAHSGRRSEEIVLRGARRTLQVTVTPLEGVLHGSRLMLLRDLTRLRRLETVRRDFISNISHELRTPLASLKALADTLQEGALEDPPAARRFLGLMHTEVDALTQMVNELVELSRIESGRVPLEIHPVPPEMLLRRAARRLEVQALRKGVSLLVACEPRLPAALADAERIEQVLVNLLHNAIKFTPAGGDIRLEAQPAAAGGVTFTVRDTGIGIPAEDLPRIFERFYKADRSRSSGGTGLGLAICRHLVEAHGGRLHVESAEGRGSAFSFTLPAPAKEGPNT